MVVRVRERNKAEKRERIRLAALKLFSEYGYDATTLRDVAREAHVALGTLSLYAADKRDLTLLVFNEITVSTMETAIDLTRSREILLEERILTFFTPFYRDWAGNPRLARIFLQINYYSGGMHGEEYTRTRRSIAQKLAFIVEDAINRGEIRPPRNDRNRRAALLPNLLGDGAMVDRRRQSGRGGGHRLSAASYPAPDHGFGSTSAG